MEVDRVVCCAALDLTWPLVGSELVVVIVVGADVVGSTIVSVEEQFCLYVSST